MIFSHEELGRNLLYLSVISMGLGREHAGPDLSWAGLDLQWARKLKPWALLFFRKLGVNMNTNAYKYYMMTIQCSDDK